MALQTLGSTQFTKYIPFANSESGTVDFDRASIRVGSITVASGCGANGNILASGNIHAEGNVEGLSGKFLSLNVGDCSIQDTSYGTNFSTRGNVYADGSLTGVLSLESCGSIVAGNTSNPHVTLNGCGAGEINATGNITTQSGLYVADSSGNNYFSVNVAGQVRAEGSVTTQSGLYVGEGCGNTFSVDVTGQVTSKGAIVASDGLYVADGCGTRFGVDYCGSVATQGGLYVQNSSGDNYFSVDVSGNVAASGDMNIGGGATIEDNVVCCGNISLPRGFLSASEGGYLGYPYNGGTGLNVTSSGLIKVCGQTDVYGSFTVHDSFLWDEGYGTIIGGSFSGLTLMGHRIGFSGGYVIYEGEA